MKYQLFLRMMPPLNKRFELTVQSLHSRDGVLGFGTSDSQ